jgi:expansin (peptidoglycan-binding protein)
MTISIVQTFMRSGCALILLVAGGSVYADSSTHTGKGTFYSYSGGGNCSLAVPTTMLTAAMNATDYANSAACGGLIKITNPDTGRSVTVRVDDQCPECAPGNVDLAQDAFVQIADIATGIIPIQWHYVANDQVGNLKLYFEGSSSQWWTAIQVRDHLYPLAKLESRLSGSSNAYTTVARESHNYFVAPNGLGIGPYDFRITDFWGQTLEVKSVQLLPGMELDTGTQFAVHVEAVGSAVDTGSNSGGGGVADWSILFLFGGLGTRYLRWIW